MKLVSVERSSNKNKKYVASFDLGDKTKKVHFGQKGSLTFIDHKNEKKKDAYLARHKVNEDWSKPDSAGALSRFILWNKETLSASIADFKKRFSL